MRAGSRRPVGVKWKTSQRKQEKEPCAHVVPRWAPERQLLAAYAEGKAHIPASHLGCVSHSSSLWGAEQPDVIWWLFRKKKKKKRFLVAANFKDSTGGRSSSQGNQTEHPERGWNRAAQLMHLEVAERSQQCSEPQDSTAGRSQSPAAEQRPWQQGHSTGFAAASSAVDLVHEFKNLAEHCYTINSAFQWIYLLPHVACYRNAFSV